MIPKNRITTSILTGASVASATVILSLFEPDRFVIPAVLATVILVFCAPYLTFGRTEGLKAERSYQLAAVVAGVAFGLVVVGQPTGGFIPPIAAAAQQGGSMLATGLAGWALWKAGGVRWQGGLGDVGCGRLFSVQRHLVRSGFGCCSSDGASALPCP